MAYKNTAPSILGTDLHINGQLSSPGDMHIDGKIEGEVRSASLTIGEAAHVVGEIAGDDVIVKGYVQGVILGKRVHLCASAHVEGEIYHEALAIETGAYFDGTAKREQNPLRKAKIQLATIEADMMAEQTTQTEQAAQNGGAVSGKVSGKAPDKVSDKKAAPVAREQAELPVRN